MMFGMTSTKVPFVVIIGRKHDCYMNLDFQSVYGIIFILKKKNYFQDVITNGYQF